MEKRHLGKTDIEITPIGLGCWQYHGGGFGTTVWKPMPQDEVDKIIKTALEGGINWFDTAEGYGYGRSEKTLSTALSNAGKVDGEVVTATKWWPFFRTARNISRTIGDRQRYLAPFSGSGRQRRPAGSLNRSGYVLPACPCLKKRPEL